MHALLADLRHAFRVYTRTPVASALAVIVLAVALAFVGSFLSLYVDLVFRPSPGFADSRELVSIGQNDGRNIGSVSQSLVDRINEEVGSLAFMSGFTMRSLEVGPERETRDIELVGDGFFAGLKPRLELGRGFVETDHDPGAEPVAVISYAYWQRAFAGLPEVLDRKLEIRGQPQFNFPGPDGQPAPRPEMQTTEFRIVGVMSEAIPALGFSEVAAWLPYELGAPLYLGPWEQVQNFQMLRGLGRLAPGASPAAVAAELDARFADAEDLGVAPDRPFDAYRGLVLDINAQRNAERQLGLFLAGSVLLAIVAAANVSLFLLARAPGRRRELGIRLAVGAPQRRLARQLATEAGLLVVAGTALGLVFGFWLQTWLTSLAFLSGARWRDASLLDWRVGLAMLAFLGVLTVLVSLAPVAGLKRLGIAASSREIRTRASLTQRAACTAQIAIGGTVAAAAIAFGWYLALLVTADRGVETRNVQAVLLTPAGPAVPPNAADFAALLVERERLREIVAATPGVEAVAFGSAAPGINTGLLVARIPRPVPPGDQVQFEAIIADRGYFEMLGIEPLSGRIYDGDEADAMVVNEAAARLMWGRSDVVGETLPISVIDAGSTEIVGVIADISHDHPDADVPARAYLPIVPFFGAQSLFVRTALASGELRTRLEARIASGELEGTIQSVQSLPEAAARLIAADRARGMLTIVSAIVVLLLAGIGFYGTQRFLVAAGRREYAIRASIGAGPSALGRLVLLRGLVLGAPGVALGSLLAFIVVAWLRDDFVSRDVSPALVTLGVVSALAALLLAASFGPAREAQRTEPAPLLRQD